MEGRLSAFELPYEPVRAEVKESDRLNQRFFLAPSLGGSAQCLNSPAFQQSVLPVGTCLAFETSQGIQSRYEMRGHALVSKTGRDASILDRQTGKVIATYKFVERDSSETLLQMFRLRKLRPLSCTPLMSRIDFAVALIPLVIGSEVAPRVSPEALTVFRASKWNTVSAPADRELTPSGSEGIAYLLAKGSIRQLKREDLSVWNRALKPPTPWIDVPEKTYLVLGSLQLPNDLYGANSVKWVLAEGMRIPSGPRGHNTFYEIGKGCVWAPTGCDK